MSLTDAALETNTLHNRSQSLPLLEGGWGREEERNLESPPKGAASPQSPPRLSCHSHPRTHTPSWEHTHTHLKKTDTEAQDWEKTPRLAEHSQVVQHSLHLLIDLVAWRAAALFLFHHGGVTLGRADGFVALAPVEGQRSLFPTAGQCRLAVGRLRVQWKSAGVKGQTQTVTWGAENTRFLLPATWYMWMTPSQFLCWATSQSRAVMSILRQMSMSTFMAFSWILLSSSDRFCTQEHSSHHETDSNGEKPSTGAGFCARTPSAYVAHQAFEENQLCLQLLNSEGQLVLAAFALLQVLEKKVRTCKKHVRKSIWTIGVGRTWASAGTFPLALSQRPKIFFIHV